MGQGPGDMGYVGTETLRAADSRAAASGLPISCYIRTLNEERRIAEVIRAAFQVADEVIVVDSGSTDATPDLAAAAGARVIRQPWLGNGKQKRVGEDAARHDWLLDLDADEIVSPDLAAEIREAFSKPQAFHMYELKLVTVPPFGEPWWTFKTAQRIKLYDRRHVRIPDHAAWDQFKPPVGSKIGHLSGALLHHSFASIEHIVAKLNRASSTRGREAEIKPLASVIFRVFFGFPFYFFKEYILRGLIRGGVYGFAFALTLAFGRWMKDVKMYERHKRTTTRAGA
jgi:glycosyltransferase involved in cell wall biosynthesis